VRSRYAQSRKWGAGLTARVSFQSQLSHCPLKARQPNRLTHSAHPEELLVLYFAPSRGQSAARAKVQHEWTGKRLVIVLVLGL